MITSRLLAPPDAHVCYCWLIVLGRNVARVHDRDCERTGRTGIATLRYQFPYMEQQSKRPDNPKVAQATVREPCWKHRKLFPTLSLVAAANRSETRDALANTKHTEPLIQPLGTRATLDCFNTPITHSSAGAYQTHGY